MVPDRYNLTAVVGPTASGKTAFAAHLADCLDGEVISADSRQVYHGMNIGTGKDYDDYLVKNRRVPCHLIDITEPGVKYNIFEYQRDFINVLKDIRARGKSPILCGGSGLYIDAITRNYRLIHVPANMNLRRELENKTLPQLAALLQSMKKLHNKTDVDTKEHAIRAIEIETFYRNHPGAIQQMPDLNTLFIGIRYERAEERRRITERLHKRLKMGMVEEVGMLLKKGISKEDLLYYGLEYKYITSYLTDKLAYDDMVSKLNIAIHQFAKRQMTWFRKMEKEGTMIHWIDGTMPLEEKIQKTLQLLNS